MLLDSLSKYNIIAPQSQIKLFSAKVEIILRRSQFGILRRGLYPNIKILQNRLFRIIIGALLLLSNAQIHRDPAFRVFSKHALTLVKRILERALRSRNSLIEDLRELDPDRSPRCVAVRQILVDV